MLRNKLAELKIFLIAVGFSGYYWFVSRVIVRPFHYLFMSLAVLVLIVFLRLFLRSSGTRNMKREDRNLILTGFWLVLGFILLSLVGSSFLAQFFITFLFFYMLLVPAFIALVARDYKIVLCNMGLLFLMFFGRFFVNQQIDEIYFYVGTFALLVWSLWAASRRYTKIYSAKLFLFGVMLYLIILSGHNMANPRSQLGGLRSCSDDIGAP